MKSGLLIAIAGALIAAYLISSSSQTLSEDDKWDELYMDYVSTFRKSYDSRESFSV